MSASFTPEFDEAYHQVTCAMQGFPRTAGIELMPRTKRRHLTVDLPDKPLIRF